VHAFVLERWGRGGCLHLFSLPLSRVGKRKDKADVFGFLLPLVSVYLSTAKKSESRVCIITTLPLHRVMGGREKGEVEADATFFSSFSSLPLPPVNPRPPPFHSTASTEKKAPAAKKGAGKPSA
jgi:hypothetical protein